MHPLGRGSRRCTQLSSILYTRFQMLQWHFWLGNWTQYGHIFNYGLTIQNIFPKVCRKLSTQVHAYCQTIKKLIIFDYSIRSAVERKSSGPGVYYENLRSKKCGLICLRFFFLKWFEFPGIKTQGSLSWFFLGFVLAELFGTNDGQIRSLKFNTAAASCGKFAARTLFAHFKIYSRSIN